MSIYFNAQFLQTGTEYICTVLTGILGNHNASYIQSAFFKHIDQTEYVRIICDTKVTADFILINVTGADDNDDFSLIRELHQHTELTVRSKAWKYSGCMIIIKKLAAKFQI